MLSFSLCLTHCIFVAFLLLSKNEARKSRKFLMQINLFATVLSLHMEIATQSPGKRKVRGSEEIKKKWLHKINYFIFKCISSIFARQHSIWTKIGIRNACVRRWIWLQEKNTENLLRFMRLLEACFMLKIILGNRRNYKSFVLRIWIAGCVWCLLCAFLLSKSRFNRKNKNRTKNCQREFTLSCRVFFAELTHITDCAFLFVRRELSAFFDSKSS